MNPNQTQQLDPDVVNLTKAIRQVESGGQVDARGGSGEYGGYQFMPETWKAYSSEAGVNVPLEQATREQQNQVAYNKIKQWKDQGYNIGQVASMWNAGPGKPDAYQEDHRGVNEFGIEYDTPNYAKKVAEAYQQMKGGQLGGNYTPPPQQHEYTPYNTGGLEEMTTQLTGKEGGFFSDVGQSFKDVGTGINEAWDPRNEQTIASGLLQTGGAVAGGAGDVIDDALINLPVVGKGYEWVTNKLGQALGGASNATGLTEWFSNQSPEVQRNIEAGLNVASVIPLFRALKYGKKGATDAFTTATIKGTEKKAIDELESSLTTKPSRRILDRSKGRGQDPIRTIVGNQEYLPGVIERNGKYYWDTKESVRAIQRDVQADELALQNLFNKTRANNPNADGLTFNINDIAATTIKDVMDKVGRTGNYDAIKRSLVDYFDNYKASMRGVEFMDISELNDIKRDIRNAINFDAVDPTGTIAKTAKWDAGQSLMRQVEDAAKKAGIKGVKELNQSMGEKLTAMDILEFLGDGKAIKSAGQKGLVRSIAEGTPVISGVARYTGQGKPSTPTTRLKERSPLAQTGRKGLVELGAGLALSGQLGQENRE